MKIFVKRSVAALLLATCFVGGVSVPTYAVNNTNLIKPYYVGASDANCTLSIVSGKATCRGLLTLRSGYTASLTLSLQKYSDGEWKTQKTWTGSGSAIQKPYYVSSGYTYRSKLSAKIYNSSGKYVETVTATSKTASC